MRTKLMLKLFSEDTPAEFKEKIAEKIEEAKVNGSSEFINDEEKLQFADSGDDSVIIEDQNNGEVTEITEKDGEYQMDSVDFTDSEESNVDESEKDKEEFEEGFEEGKEYEEGKEAEKEDDERNYSDSAKWYVVGLDEDKNGVIGLFKKSYDQVDKPTKESILKSKPNLKNIRSFKVFKDYDASLQYASELYKIMNGEKRNYSEETKSESETQPDVKTEIARGADGDHIENSNPEVKIDITTGIKDAKKAGLKNFSVTIKGATAEYAAKFTKLFADAVKEAEDEALDEEIKAQSDNLDESKLDTLKHNVEELAEAVSDLEESKDEELAKKIKAISKEMIKECEECDSKEAEEIKSQCKTYADKADEVIKEKKEEKEDSEKLDAVKHELEDLAKAVDELEESKDEKLAKEVKEMADKLAKECEECDSEEAEEIKSQCKTYADKADEVLKEETKELKEDESESKEDVTEEQKEECDDKTFSACFSDFDNLGISPKISIEEQKLFSSKSVSRSKEENPFLYTQFD